MKIALTTQGPSWDADMDPRFGRTAFLLIFDDQLEEMTVLDNRQIFDEMHGAGTRTAQQLFDLHPDVLITGNGPGENAASILRRSGIRVFTGASQMTAKQAIESFRNGNLNAITL